MSIEEFPRKRKLVMYASTGLVNQYFRQYADDLTRVIEKESRSTQKELRGGIGGILGSLNGVLNKKSGTEVIKEINLNSEYYQVRALMNVFAQSELVYPITEFKKGNQSPTGLYTFDTNLQLVLTEEHGEKFIEVRGIENEVDFSGVTSYDNWSTRSFVTNALRTIDPFPFEGVLMPLETTDEFYRETDDGFELEMLDMTVQFLFILAPDPEDYVEWANYQKLVRDHPREIDETGIEELVD